MMPKTASSMIIASVAAVSLALAAPAYAVTKYYQQTVVGSTKTECEAAGTQLAQQKMAEGYLVTWIGCGYANFRYSGLVSWSD